MISRIITAVVAAIILMLAAVAAAQSGRERARGGEPQKAAQPGAERRGEPQQSEAIKIDTTLITVPVIASDRNDLYIPDLRQEEFTVYEDGVRQEIVFFATVTEPFHVVLMLDTSASTQEKLGQIQRAATAFVGQLQPADRVKIISFDDAVRELSDFTNERAALKRAIDTTRPGQGTKLYDAMRLALITLERVKGRKAIVLFTDGVDWHSDTARYDDNIRELEEAGVIVYPIRYDTRPEVEEMMRRQREAGQVVDLGVIFGGPPRGTTPPTVPGGTPVPTGRPGGQRDPYGLPIPPIIITGPGSGRYPGGSRFPDDRPPTGGRFPDDRFPDSRNPDPRYPDRRNDPTSPRGRRDDSISSELDMMYHTADAYLTELADKSGGKLHRADMLGSLPAAFAQIAAELRQQYSLGYYPANAARDGKYRKIQVRVSRKGVVVRARPGYRAKG
jgi:Mg-chelatase subunit ChlD